MPRPPLELTRAEILAFRRRAGALDERLPPGARSLRRAAWAGLTDSVPRAALLSIHARVEQAHPSSWEDPSLVQVWGPRFSVYVVPTRDRAIFTLARLPDDEARRQRAQDIAGRVHTFLAGRRLRDSEVQEALGLHNGIKSATATGTLLIRWEGARAPWMWTVPAPEIDRLAARRELARRYLHIFGPATSATFAEWAGLKSPEARATFDALGKSLTAVRTPIGEASILARATSLRFARRMSLRRRRGCSRAATPTFSCGEPTANSSFPTRAGVPSCGRRASGPAPSSSPERSSAPGGEPGRT